MTSQARTRAARPAVTMEDTVYENWQVVEETALDKLSLAAGYMLRPVEIISPVFRATDGTWRPELSGMIVAVRECCEIHLISGCSTHIHVSPGSQGKIWSQPQLCNVAKGIVFFEVATTKIMPSGRKRNTIRCLQ